MSALIIGLSLSLATPPPDNHNSVRIAVFNIWELSRNKLDQTDENNIGTNNQLRGAAEIIQRVRPDILLINEIDYDHPQQLNARLFHERYLSTPQGRCKPLSYPHIFFQQVNTGVPTHLDLNNDGQTDGPDDCFGYGQYPGQYAMALYSRFPLDTASARTFHKLLWKAMPDNLMPDGTNDKPAWYSPPEAAVLRLSSKSHWDVPVIIGETHIHLLCSHPTPPVFDGPEDRNGRRNFDEIRFWADYLSEPNKTAYIIDDTEHQGGLLKNQSAIILGDLNADPTANPPDYGITAIDQLLRHPRLQDPRPSRDTSVPPATATPTNADSLKTCNFGRLDYALPTKDLTVISSGVYWPSEANPQHNLVIDRQASSDHHLVWVDIEIPTH